MHTVSVTADAGDQMGRVPLHYTALEGPVDQVRALLDEGADVAATDKQGFTALHFACQQNRSEVAEALLDAGAPVDPVDQWGNTPLWRAVFNAKGDPRLVRTLVDAGAGPGQENFSGSSPRQLVDQIGNYDASGHFESA